MKTMLKTLKLYRNIKRFYKIFGGYINSDPNPIKLRDLKSHDFLLGVQFDLFEAIGNDDDTTNPMNIWLTKIINHINNIIL